ncbi:protein of unknown function [Blastococcus saxobsidens DD2]|uniref:Uncharacterized protein n=1 Tax=Blastococcus saxobsidens (strain DD2) TaxID=1146883 RepID=H6RJ96_BLASD|nr:protein of unknown function [Blastococcus saxobsidens DD2]
MVFAQVSREARLFRRGWVQRAASRMWWPPIGRTRLSPKLCTFLGTTSRSVDVDRPRPGGRRAQNRRFRRPQGSTQVWTTTCRPVRGVGRRPSGR